MKAYQFNFDKALEDNGFYARDAFFEISDIEIRLLFLSSLFVNAEMPFKEFSCGIFNNYDKILVSCIDALNIEKNNHLSDKKYFKLNFFKEVIDCMVMKVCFNSIQRFTHFNRLEVKDNGILIDKNGNTILDVFATWQSITGSWIPSTSIGQEYALSFDDRINAFRPFMGWKINKRINTK